ncbi:MAG: plasmid recombination protein [Lachnospiraceae bacterium]|nr:plasmid recombination protein [Lachnospiraceae bacterium]
MEVDSERSCDNYSIIRRGETAAEINDYRKKIESECFHYNRKNLVHAHEIICTLPTDCPPNQEKQFFVESYKYIASTIPFGERAIFLAEVVKNRLLNNL